MYVYTDAKRNRRGPMPQPQMPTRCGGADLRLLGGFHSKGPIVTPPVEHVVPIVVAKGEHQTLHKGTRAFGAS